MLDSEETRTAMEADGIDMSTVVVEYVSIEAVLWIRSGAYHLASYQAL